MLQRLFDLLKDVFRTLFTENLPFTIVCGLGFVAIFTLLPKPRRSRVVLGAVAGVAAIVLSFFLVIRIPSGGSIDDRIEQFLFYLFSAGALVSGGLLVTQRNPARAALSFAIVILCTCGLFLLQAAPFLMVATIIVYAGAIIVTFLFVIMLAQQQGPSDADARSREPFLATLTGFMLLAALLFILKANYKPDINKYVSRTKQFLQKIEEYHEQAELRRSQPNTEQVRLLVAQLKQFTSDFERWWTRPKGDLEGRAPRGGKDLSDAFVNLRNLLEEPADNSSTHLETLELHVSKLYAAAIAVRDNPVLAGGSRPTPPKLATGDPSRSPSPLSEMSGPSASREPGEIRRDPQGRPVLPAENTRYLGQSLFSDYLLGVELAGMLLLVATIGAIAIATRRPLTPGTSPTRGEGGIDAGNGRMS